MKKKLMSTLFAVCTILFAFGLVTVSAATSGTCGDNLTWVLDDTGTLTIKGKGPMDSWTFYENLDIRNVVIEDGTTTIGDYTFYECSNLESITIPNSVTVIGPYAFRNCDSLISITIPNSINTIADKAFYSCDNLKKVNITDLEAWCNIKFHSGSSNPLNCADELYLNGNLVTDLTIPDGVTSIGNSVFYGCNSIVRITIPDSVTSIGAQAFYDCDSLVSITIPDSVTVVGTSAFDYCHSLKKVNITNLEAWCNIYFADSASTPFSYAEELYLNGNLVTDVTIPDGVTDINDYAFNGCASLINITIPDSVTFIGNYAFSNCVNLKSVTIPDSVKIIGDGAFSYCDSLVNITIPNCVTSISNTMFSNCRSLLSITIPNSVMSIGEAAFYRCDSLADIIIPDSVTSIGDRAFSECGNLINVTIGKGVTTLPQESFFCSSKLKYVVLPAEIEYIKNDAFNYCPDIEIVFYVGNESAWNDILFYSRNENLTNAKVVYNATRKIYKFATNCDAKLSDITDFVIFTMPTVQNDGKTLTGWYDNEALSGNPVTFPYYGDATTLYAAWADRSGNSFDDAFIAKASKEYTVTTTESNQYVYFEFVPSMSKKYHFYTTGNKDTYGFLYNSQKSQLASNDADGDGNNFYISYNLSAGETYYIAVKLYNEPGTFTFVVEEPLDYRINEITLKDMSGNSLQTIPTGHFLATVSFTNVTSNADAVIVLAKYTAAGTFKGLMYIQTEDVPTDSTIKLSIPVDNSNGNIAKLKAFCWESFGTMTPTGNSSCFPTE